MADDKDKQNDDLSNKVEVLTDAVGKLAEGMKSIQANYGNLSENVNQLASLQQDFYQRQQQQSQTSDTDEDEEDTFMNFDDKSLEDLNRAQFMQVMMGQFSKMLEKNNKQLMERVESVDSKVHKNDVRAELQAVVDRYEDFPYFKDEVKKILADHPEYSIKAAYLMAKEDNPEKASQVAEQLKAAKDDKEGDDKDPSTENKSDDGSEQKRTSGYGGLTPTSGQREGKPANMSTKEAAEDAWAESMKGIDLDGLGQ